MLRSLGLFERDIELPEIHYVHTNATTTTDTIAATITTDSMTISILP